MSAPLYASATAADERTLWRTDPRLVDAIVARFGPLHVDASASAGMAIPGVVAQITPEDDALGPRAWSSYAPRRCAAPAIWLNSPWGGGGLTRRWVHRALTEIDRGAGRLLMLVPESTDCAWWWLAARRARAAYSLGRISYLDVRGQLVTRPGFGSTLFYFLPGDKVEEHAAFVSWRDCVPRIHRPRLSVLA